MSKLEHDELPFIEDPLAKRVIDQIFLYGGEATSRELEKELVTKRKTMARATLYNKLQDLHQDGWIFKKPMIRGARAVVCYTLPKAVMKTFQRSGTNRFDALMAEALSELEDPNVPKEVKEGILAGLLKGYMARFVDWTLDTFKEYLETESWYRASKDFSLSTRYLFGLYLFRVMSLYWSHKEYGEKALEKVEAFFEDFTIETPRKERA